METIARNASLADMVEVLKDQNARKLDVVADASAIRAQDDGTVTIAGIGEAELGDDGVTVVEHRFEPLPTFDVGVCRNLEIPGAYFRRMRAAGLHSMVAANMNGWLDHNGGRHLVRAFSGERPVVRALLSSKYQAVDNLDGLLAVLDGIREAGVQVQVRGGDISERKMYLRVACEDVRVLAPALLEGYRNPFFRRPGNEGPESTPPVVFAGFEFRNSELGFGAWEIIPRLEVLVCRNGMTAPVDRFRRVHLGSALEDGIVSWTADTQRKVLEAVKAQTADAVRTFLSPEYVQGVVDAMTEKATAPLAVGPQRMVEVVTKPLGLDEGEQDELLRLFISGGQVDRVGGVMQAVTALAQTVEEADRAAALEDGASSVLDLRELVATN